LLVPHVRRAVQMGKQIDLEQVRVATFTNVLNGLSAGLFLVAADGKLMHANAAGEAMLATEDCLRSTCGRLVICNPDVHSLLQKALPGSTGAAPGNNPVLPVIARNGDRYLIHVLPLSSDGQARPSIGRAAAAVFVRKAALEGLVPQAIARAFDLTPAELRVLLAIFEFGGIPQAATMLGVADSTVKTHVGRLFEKTGTSRQADLVKLAAGYNTPLLN
jgi:DNA-binding CsgD family transcriptional regulator